MADNANGAAKTKRPKKSPVFHVFQQEGDDATLFRLLTVEDGKLKPVTDVSRKAAISGVAAEAEGVFAAIRENEWRPLGRKAETTVTNTWTTA